MESQWPKITVVTPSFNQGRFVGRTIESVLSQEYPNLEYFVLDAGSTDGTVEVLQRYSDRLTYWHSRPDHGQSEAILQGWRRGEGQIVTWLNSDDYYLPGALRAVGNYFQENPATILFSGAAHIVNEQEKVLRTKPAPPITARHLLPWGTVPGQPATFLARRAFEQVGGPRLDLHYVMDWELWLRISLAYPEQLLHRSEKVIAAAREWSNCKTLTAGGRDAAEVRRVLQEVLHRPGLPGTLGRLRQRALATTWWREAQGYAAAHNQYLARTSLWKAFRLAPSLFCKASRMQQAVGILLAKPS